MSVEDVQTAVDTKDMCNTRSTIRQHKDPWLLWRRPDRDFEPSAVHGLGNPRLKSISPMGKYIDIMDECYVDRSVPMRRSDCSKERMVAS